MLRASADAVVLSRFRRVAVENVLRRHVVAGLAGLAPGWGNPRRTVAGQRIQRVIRRVILDVVLQRIVEDVVI